MKQLDHFSKKPAYLLQRKSAYRKSLDELLSLEFTGMKLGLDNIRELLSLLGDPHKKIESIHVAGSNGKGSVSAMLAAALQANTYKTGLYTSPHLVDFRERIKINGEFISEDYITLFLEKIWKDVDRLHATFFEVTTALAFAYFADSGVEVSVIETGLGGRLDATNVLERPLATVVTSISLEHTAQLGNTLQEISGEKAGIMKPDVAAIVNVRGELKEVFIKKAKELNSPIIFTDEYLTPAEYETLRSPLLGSHQEQNLRTVLATIENIALPLKINLSIEGIGSTQKLTGLRGRMEEYDYFPARKNKVNLILDVGHNSDAFKYVKKYFINNNIKPIVIAGFAKDKDIEIILKEIKEFASSFVSVTANSHRAISSIELAELAKKEGLKTIVSTTPKTGVDEAIRIAKSGDTLLLTGSHFVVGDFLKEVENTE